MIMNQTSLKLHIDQQNNDIPCSRKETSFLLTFHNVWKLLENNPVKLWN